MRRLFLIWVALAALLAGEQSTADKEAKFIGSRWKYWAFQKVVRPETPTPSGAWVRTPIDEFILKALAAKKLTPSQPLDRIG